MSKLESVMVLYGAIDEIAVKAQAPEIIKTLKRRFRTATEIDQRGWYGELIRLSGAGVTGKHKITAADITAALKDLATVTLADDAAPDKNALTVYDLQRLYYIGAALRELRQLPAVASDPTAPMFAFELADLDAVLERINSLNIPNLGEAPPKCTSSVRKVNDDYCTVLLTESENADVTLDQLAAVLDPENWPKLSTFFQAIEIRKPTDRGWGRMLEVVETGSGNGFTLRTPLKYWKGDIASGGGLFINYDMDDNAFQDPTSDHLVLIDNGFIVAMPLNPDEPDSAGVRLVTSKELLIRGMSPTAAANLACRMGWADAGNQMFFDTAKRLAELPNDNEWKKSMTPWEVSHENTAAPYGPGAGRIPPETWTLPAQNRKQIIDTAAAEARTMVDSTFGTVGRFLQRWQDGLTPEEITETGTDLGKELTRSYQTLFTTAMDAVRPATRRS